MSDTPRTDQVMWCDSEAECEVVSADFARQLERELSKVTEAIEWLLDCAEGETPQSMQDAVAFAKSVISKR